MDFINRKSLLLIAIFLFSFVFSSNAHATYSYGWKKYSSYSQSYNSYRHHGYRSRYSRWNYSKRRYHWSQSRYRYNGFWKKPNYHQPVDKKPVAVDDIYAIKKGASIAQNVIIENDIQGDGQAMASLVFGSLPSGIELAVDGSLTGATDQLGTFEAYYKIRDKDGDYSKAKIIISVTEEVVYCPQPAESDELHGGSNSHALWVPAISRNLRFMDEPSSTRTLPEGNLLVSGTVADGDHEFDINLTFSRFSDTSDNPKLELKSSAYVVHGGVIDPSTWDFYSHLEGTVIGTKGEWAGTKMSLAIRGPKGQIGVGANGKNQNFGFSSWFDLTIEGASTSVPEGFHVGQQLYGDINIDLPDECPPVREVVLEQCSVAAELDSFGQYGGSHSIVLFGLSKFVFEPAADVLVYNNGDVEINGTVLDSQGQGFDASFVYAMPTDSGIPKLELIDAAYVDMAGPVDPSTWRYFESFTGTLIGRDGDYAGVEVSLAPRGPIAQLGFGANGKNVGYGLSNWLTATVVSGNAVLGLKEGDTRNGDINIDIKDNCDEVPDEPVDAVDDSYFFYPYQNVDVNILDNDVLGDPETTLTFDPATIPAGFSLSPEGQLTGFSTVGSVVLMFDYTITDADGDTDTATVTITLSIEPG